jgi:hypothetical protein
MRIQGMVGARIARHDSELATGKRFANGRTMTLYRPLLTGEVMAKKHGGDPTIPRGKGSSG